MNRVFAVSIVILIFCFVAFGQKVDSKPPVKATVDSKAINSESMDLAKATYAAHGGDKLKAVKTMVIKGSVDVTSPALPQAIPGGFSMAFAGDKYRIEISTVVQSLKQSFDGEQTYTSKRRV